MADLDLGHFLAGFIDDLIEIDVADASTRQAVPDLHLEDLARASVFDERDELRPVAKHAAKRELHLRSVWQGRRAARSGRRPRGPALDEDIARQKDRELLRKWTQYGRRLRLLGLRQLDG